MKVQVIAVSASCEGGNCPTTYVTDRGSVLVQGDRTARGRRFAEVTQQLLQDHAQRLGGSRWTGRVTPTSAGTVLVEGDVVDDVEALQSIGLPPHETLVEIHGTVIA
ncbi:hypothetical protein EV383_6194 [Pseudonocardia sediminis]|uniref:Uncharacterized protein n=1 Tax=Pseudonocardia sediminis TaxID=1397368 RepID=A0A4Q7U7E8_PSEST|nr:hypothetical protein EV383_6194 [Pseudonocardia sediminis]